MLIAGPGTRVFLVTVFGHPGVANFKIKKKTESRPQAQKKGIFDQIAHDD